MRDQAETLRLKMLRQQGELGRAIAVVSGKGGVGKSNFTMNFATTLANKGKKVVIVDMDIGMGNINILIGKNASYSLKDYLEGNKLLDEVIFAGPYDLKFISGGSGMSGVLEWSEVLFERLIQAFEQLQKSFDYILFDMGAGATNWSLDLLASIDEIIVLSTAEPTSITDAYSMMKYIHTRDADKQFYILCNRAHSKEEGLETNERLKRTMKRFLDKEVTILGALPEDSVVRKAVREQVPFSLAFPDALITKTLHLIVARFMEHRAEEVHAHDQSAGKFLTKLRSIFSKGRD
ncbi:MULTISPECIES: MinD/ParA family protein [unclassified Lysinibacillus]|uniref:MinD/ParA family protein n=1 Tax=unclassified Lysinibacillus TaxID=2636778 RepID=UPI0020117D8F|nr:MULTISPECIES: MinD/ParA family protein [unclassified Lysinibacillus]MCL1695446.1 MinD/ParA family protein [Lysinibacillus sp. BPa_S21]MCL1700310.1 MinD/ParA family protein [Lysinibacillus sp. Bpr_S20]